MNGILSRLLLGTLLGASVQADNVTRWTFNSIPPDGSTTTGTLIPSVGMGTATVLGTPRTAYATGSPNDPAAAANDNSGLQLSGFPPQSTGSRTSGVRFDASTVGFSGVSVSFSIRLTATAARHLRFQYTINGSDFQDGPGFSIPLAGVYTNFLVDLAGISGVQNNQFFGFRLVTEFASDAGVAGGSQYLSVFAGTAAAYSSNGTMRVDMVTVSGNSFADSLVAQSLEAANVTLNTATLQGALFGPAQNVQTFFDYGLTTDYGIRSPLQSLTPDPNGRPVSADLVDLAGDSTYHFRLVARIGGVEYFGRDVTFRTLGCLSPESRHELRIRQSGGGIVSSIPACERYPSGTLITLDAQPAGGWELIGWLGLAAPAAKQARFRILDDVCARAVFGTTVDLAAIGGGSVRAMPSLPLYPHGSRCRIVATPSPGYYFAGWSGALRGSNNPSSIVYSSPKPQLVANFQPLPNGYSSVTINPIGRGQVQTSRAGNIILTDTRITNFAIADPNEQFIGWSGDLEGAEIRDQTNLVLKASGTKYIEARFTSRMRIVVEECFPQLQSNGLLLAVSGDPGGSYLIQRATLLDPPRAPNWTDVGVVSNAWGTVEILDPSAAGAAAQYYRAVQVLP